MIGLPTKAARVAIFFGFAMLVAAAPAQAQGISDQLCGGRGGGQNNWPAEAELVRAADAAEQRLRSERRSSSRLEGAVAALDLAPSTATLPDPVALARYCMAAGEVMRLSVDGSQLQAQSYLLTSVRLARDIGSEQLMSQAAYRLGLVSLAGPPVGGARGGGSRLRRSGSQISAELREAHAETEACSSLARTRLESSSNSVLSTLALDCAARQALDAGDPDLSARASLRLARLNLAWSESAAEDPGALRQVALETAVAAIPHAMLVADPLVRAELVGRLVETALDLGAAADPAVVAGISVLQRDQAIDPTIASLHASLSARLALARGDPAAA